MSHHDVTFFLLALGALLITARILGEVAERARLPSVVGEIIAGILLGPTLLGRISPVLQANLFPDDGPGAIALKGFSTVAVVMFLLVAGLEIDLSTVWRRGSRALIISFSGIAGTFLVGASLGWFFQDFFLIPNNADALVFALFIGTAMAISALPVIAKTMMDLNMFRTGVGQTVMAIAVVDDIVGWSIFAVILGMIGGGVMGIPINVTIASTLAFAILMLTVGRRLFHASLPWIQAHSTWPGGVLGVIMTLGMVAAAFTEWIGVHAIFGAFIVGVAVGDSEHLRKRTRTTLEQFVSFIFAPIFFATLALKVDFVVNFDPLLTLAVFCIATASKVIGCRIGAWLARIPNHEAWAIAFGMNARGAMEIIIGLIALEAGLIGEPLFVALVIMALGTSMLSGPMMEFALRRKRPAPFYSYIPASGFISKLEASDRHEAITELCNKLADDAGISAEELIDSVWQHEQMVAAGLANRMAVPNAQVPGLQKPIMAIGLAPRGIDFHASDGQTARIICLVLVPEGDGANQWAILSEITRLLEDSTLRTSVLDVKTHSELIALFKLDDPEQDILEEDKERRGVIFVGANKLIRMWARRLNDLDVPVWIIDSDKKNIDAAQQDGLNVVSGSGTSEVTLTAAHVFEAHTLIAATGNEYTNLEITRFARNTFALPEVLVVDGGLELKDDTIHQLAIDKELLDNENLTSESFRWEVVLVKEDGVLTDKILPPGCLPLIVEGSTSKHTGPAWPGMELSIGDEVHCIGLDLSAD